MKKRNLSLWAVLFWLLVWQAGSMALHSDILLVSPLRVLQTLLALIQTTRFWSSLLGSMGRILGGFLLAAALLPGFVRLVELISPKGPELEIISRQIANAHTLFNICCALLWLPLLPWMVRLVCALVPEE